MIRIFRTLCIILAFQALSLGNFGQEAARISPVSLEGTSPPEGLSRAEWAEILAQLPGNDGSQESSGEPRPEAVVPGQKLYNGSGGAGDSLGFSVAMDAEAEWVVVGACYATVNGQAQHGYAYLFNRKPGGGQWSPMGVLLPPDGAVNWHFGYSVAIQGDKIVVGAPGAYGNRGRLYIYYRNQGGADYWGFVTACDVGDAGAQRMGTSIALDGDVLAAGEPGFNATYTDQGAVVIFYRNQYGADAWGGVTRIFASDPAANDLFGTSVAMDHGVIVVGSPYKDGGRGAAYLYGRNQGGADAWGFQKKLTASDSSAEATFGLAVSKSRDRILVAAPFATIGANVYQGAAYLFDRNRGGADQWGETKKLTASDGSVSDAFGFSVALDDGMALIGAPGTDTLSEAAYLFSQNQGGADNWGEIRKLCASDGAPGDNFGYRVALRPGVALVSASHDQIGGNAGQGSAYLFRYDDGWKARNTLTAYDAGSYAWKCFGEEVALSGDIAAVRAAPSLYNNSDETYIFYRNQGGSHAWQFVKKLTVPLNYGPSADENQWDLDLDGDVLVIGSPYEGTYDGAAYIFYRNQGGADNWGLVKRIDGSDLPYGWGTNYFGWSVALENGTLVVGATGADGGQTYPTGGAAIFYRNRGGPDNWGHVANIFGEIGEQEAGAAVAISGDIVVMGAPVEPIHSGDATRAFVHRRNLGGLDAWGRVKTLGALPYPNSFKKYGFSVAAFDDIVAVGCPMCRFDWSGQGAVFIYQMNQGGPSAWEQVAQRVDSNAFIWEYLGYDLALEGDRIVVGGYGYDENFLRYNYRTLVFTRHFGGADHWGQEATLSTAAGKSVAISGRAILASDHWANGNDGAAYFFYNHAPLAVGDSYSTPTGAPLTVAAPGVRANDSDQNGDAMTVSKDTDPVHGTVTLNADGSFTYTPTPGYCGPDTFTYHLSDGAAPSDGATVSLDITVGAPTDFAVTDDGPCASGLTVTFTAGSCATSHDLVRDGSVVVTGITSGSTYTPGDNASHAYKVRAVGTYGSTDSDEVAAADANDTPGAPSITGITDVSPCAATGIQVAYSAGSGATSHDLLKDSVVVVTGYASGATYLTGDTATHAYIVRAVKGACTTNSPASDGTDVNDTPGAPSITSITDENACAQSGIRVSYSAGSGAAGHNLLLNGAVVVTGYVSGALYNPGNTNSYTYSVRAVNGTCTTDSAGRVAADFNTTPTAPEITGITDEDANAQTGIRVAYTAGSGAASHHLLRNGSLAVTDYASGALYDPGTTGSVSYAVRAVYGTCKADSSASAFSDTASTADLGLAITDNPDPVCLNDSLTATVTASNGGPGTAGATLITGTLPASLDLGLTGASDDDATDFGSGTHAGTLWDGTNLTVEPAWTSQWELPDSQQNTWIDMTGNVALYHMNESSGVFADVSGNGNAGTPYGGVIQGVAGRISGGAWFDGNDDYAEVPDAPELNPTTEVTLAFWVRFLSVDGDRKILIKREGPPYKGFNFGTFDGCLYAEVWDTAGSRYAFIQGCFDAAATAAWHHCAMTWKSGGRFRGYVDGVLVRDGGASANPISQTANPLRVVSKNGALDEMAVWTRELSQTEIQTLYNRQAPHFSGTYTSRIMDAGANRTWTTLEWAPHSPYGKELPGGGASESVYPAGNASMTGNKALYHLNEASGIIQDSSGNGYDGTPSGGPTCGAEGRFKTALDFDGTDDLITLTNANTLGFNGNFTVSAWVRPDAVNGDRTILGTAESAVNQGLHLIIRNGKFHMGFYSNDTGGTQTLTAGTWYHVLFRYDGGEQAIFVNGAQDAASSGHAAFAGTGIVRIGRWIANTFFDGRIDEVAIWSRALSSTEISDLYLRGAARLKFQVRTCDEAACSGETFTGPGGTANDYYSELDNTTLVPPVLAVRRQANNHYFQYRVVLEFDGAGALPQLTSVTARHSALGALTPTQGTCGLAGQTLLCDLGTIANGANASATVTGTATALGSITTSGTVSSGSIDATPGNNSASQDTTVVDCSLLPPVQNTGDGAAKFSKNPDGDTLSVTYDATTCSGAKAILLYGTLGSWAGYQGSADCDLGNSGSDPAVNAAGLDNVWFNIVWTSGTVAGHPGYATSGTRTWTVGTHCSMKGDNHSHATCP